MGTYKLRLELPLLWELMRMWTANRDDGVLFVVERLNGIGMLIWKRPINVCFTIDYAQGYFRPLNSRNVFAPFILLTTRIAWITIVVFMDTNKRSIYKINKGELGEIANDFPNYHDTHYLLYDPDLGFFKLSFLPNI